MGGYFKRFLEVDLTRGTLEEGEIPDKWIESYLGGYGFAHRYLIENLKPGIDPLDEENILIFAVGPFQGTGFPGSGRHVVAGESPKTKAPSDSYAGGYFAHELGRSGFDMIVIRGKSKHPVYLLITSSGPEIRDASDLWGLDIAATESSLKQRHPGVRVASIGPAGENLVKFACIINDYSRAAGRPGFGAVMGAKKLKAIAVQGTKAKPIFDTQGLKSSSRSFARWLMEDPATQALAQYGSSGSVEALDELGILPTRNFIDGTFKGASSISGQRLANTFLIRRETCTGCPVACKRVVRTRYRGHQVHEVYGGPEYETVAALGSLCLVDDLAAICYANQKCNAYGLDTISVGVTVAFAMEASERGLIDEKIPWGDADVLLKLIDDIAYKRGLGAELARGIDELARELQADFAVQIKGLEVAMHEPRGKVGLAISYATSPRGGTHLEAFHDTMVENLAQPIEELGLYESKDRFDWERTPELCKLFEDLMSFTNSLVMCANISWAKTVGSYYPYGRIRQALAQITGREISADEMLKIGERNYILRKLLAIREGLTRDDDDLPPRLKQPLQSGASAGRPISHEELQRRIDEYYELRGFDRGIPTRGRLQALGMDDVLQYLPYE